jgi:hypothetical protein
MNSVLPPIWAVFLLYFCARTNKSLETVTNSPARRQVHPQTADYYVGKYQLSTPARVRLPCIAFLIIAEQQ